VVIGGDKMDLGGDKMDLLGDLIGGDRW